jgi:hypothetical protein
MLIGLKLCTEGLSKSALILVFQRDDGAAFHSSLQFKTLPNGEKVNRSWVVYSPTML